MAPDHEGEPHELPLITPKAFRGRCVRTLLRAKLRDSAHKIEELEGLDWLGVHRAGDIF